MKIHTMTTNQTQQDAFVLCCPTKFDFLRKFTHKNTLMITPVSEICLGKRTTKRVGVYISKPCKIYFTEYDNYNCISLDINVHQMFDYKNRLYLRIIRDLIERFLFVDHETADKITQLLFKDLNIRAEMFIHYITSIEIAGHVYVIKSLKDKDKNFYVDFNATAGFTMLEFITNARKHYSLDRLKFLFMDIMSKVPQILITFQKSKYDPNTVSIYLFNAFHYGMLYYSIFVSILKQVLSKEELEKTKVAISLYKGEVEMSASVVSENISSVLSIYDRLRSSFDSFDL